jgi:DNA-binding MarR family transcriptional regulator
VRDRDHHEILLMMFDIVGRLRAHLAAVAAEFDLSPQQARALRWLDDPLPMGALAEALHCDASNVTGITDRLESRGLVERSPGERDRRVKHLVLTDEGRTLRDRLLTRLHAESPVVDPLTDEERATLKRLLHRIIAADPEWIPGRFAHFAAQEEDHP